MLFVGAAAVLFAMVMEIPRAQVPGAESENYAGQLKLRFGIGKSAQEAERDFMLVVHNAIGMREQTILDVYNRMHMYGRWFTGFFS